MKTVTVILSYKNAARTLRRCLSCLQRQDYTALKVVVVDGGSTDGSQAIAFSFANDKRFYVFIVPGNEATGEAWAIRNFPADIYLFTNSDIYMRPEWASLHVAWHEKGYDLVGGKQAYIGDAYDFAWSYMTPKLPYGVLTEGLSMGFPNCSVTREMFEKAGGLDESLYWQHDMDFFLRCIKQGATLALDPRIEVFHDHPLKSFKASFFKSLKYGINHAMLLRLHTNSRTWAAYPMWPFARTLTSELLMVHGVKVWKQQRRQEKPSAIGFEMRRLFAVQIPSKLGTAWGLIAKPDWERLKRPR